MFIPPLNYRNPNLDTCYLALLQVADVDILMQLKRKFLSFWYYSDGLKMKWDESGFRPPLCTYRLNWARRTSWGWWDDWDDTVLQTQDSKFEPWWSEVEHATSRSHKLPTILIFTRGWGRNIFCFFQTVKTASRAPNSGVKGSGANHYPRAPAQFDKGKIYINVSSFFLQ